MPTTTPPSPQYRMRRINATGQSHILTDSHPTAQHALDAWKAKMRSTAQIIAGSGAVPGRSFALPMHASTTYVLEEVQIVRAAPLAPFTVAQALAMAQPLPADFIPAHTCRLAQNTGYYGLARVCGICNRPLPFDAPTDAPTPQAPSPEPPLVDDEDDGA